MFKSLIEEIRFVLDEEGKKLMPWNRPSPQALRDNETKLRAMGMTTSTKKKVLVKGPFNSTPEKPIRTGNPHNS